MRGSRLLRFSSAPRPLRSSALQALRLTCLATLAVSSISGCAPPHAEGVATTSVRATRSQARSQPDWIDRSVAYGVLPPLFGEAGLRDVTRALDSLHDLGVNVLWLAPFIETPTGDVGYAATDNLRVRSDYGTDADLAEFVREAEAREMRVILDLPANPTSVRHSWYSDATARGRESPYYDYYERATDGSATHHFDWTHLSHRNYQNAALATVMLDTSQRWIVQFSIDGYRFELGVHAWKGVFDEPIDIPKRLHAAILETQKHTREQQLTWRFLDDSDTAERFITRHGEGMTRVATAALLTLPGIPCVYSFDEVGAEYQPNAALRPVTPSRPELRDFHWRWIRMRRARAALSGNGFSALHVGESGHAAPTAFAYLRQEASETLLVVLSFSATPTELTLQLPAPHWGKKSARDLMRGEELTLEENQLRVQLEPWDARIFEPR